VKTDGSNSTGKDPNGTKRDLLTSLDPWRELVEKFIALKIQGAINPNTLRYLPIIINSLYALFGLKFPASNFANVFDFKTTKDKVREMLNDFRRIYGNDAFLASFIDALKGKVDVDDIFYMTNLHTLVTEIDNYKGNVMDLEGIYGKIDSQGGGRKLTRRRKSKSKSKRYNKHGSKRRSSHKRSHNKRR
jgi:CYTH domain-containing protein